MQLKNILDKFYREYDFQERMRLDPIEFPHRYKDPRDIEVSGFIAASLAYGRVDLFKTVIEKILMAMGRSPYEFLLDFDAKKNRKLFQGISYRFNKNEDIICMIFILHKILKKYSSLEDLFMKFYKPHALNIREALEGYVEAMLNTDTSIVYAKDIRPAGLLQFFPSPGKGSTCKRSNLFLRWMVRDKDIDFGIWKGIPMNKLVIPLDTHIAKISKCLGFTSRNSQDWKTAVEITETLKKFDPEDPLKYDFALCHHGISGVCKGKRENEACKGCVFKGFLS
ncbi:MAG: TIGR02757 family protein [Nitrospirae bacterium GWC2_42_7]|nr:MAG: TIGR02757 family protein [Nitrospirae bacterium GWC2_42_7]